MSKGCAQAANARKVWPVGEGCAQAATARRYYNRAGGISCVYVGGHLQVYEGGRTLCAGGHLQVCEGGHTLCGGGHTVYSGRWVQVKVGTSCVEARCAVCTVGRMSMQAGKKSAMKAKLTSAPASLSSFSKDGRHVTEEHDRVMLYSRLLVMSLSTLRLNGIALLVFLFGIYPLDPWQHNGNSDLPQFLIYLFGYILNAFSACLQLWHPALRNYCGRWHMLAWKVGAHASQFKNYGFLQE
ncbi:hypothetical protein CYMTET_25052 [Cymbomonas tetramitiformis]|uniref:Uncharacterized protein n=1 Tax=Cymbomonas tetramitiformis TaxID=36881 RepID=A0AAE0KZK2_9CHLO|nr:hypothetical protein CYMTET_25052 [Cymbomonas tetramitiformis]